jgi:hypothetical protein
MFWKVVGGIVAFFMVVVLAVTLLATAGAAVLGLTVASVVDNLDISTVQVTDAGGNTETYDVDSLVAESGRIEITGDDGEQVTIDLEVPQITIQERGEEGGRVVIGGGPRFRGNIEVPHVRIDGRSFDHFDGGFAARAIGGFIRGLFTLMFWTVVLVGVWLVLRSRRPSASEPKEKTPDAIA